MTKHKADASDPLPALTCLRCKFRWRPLKSKVDACPKCKSPHWWQAPKRGIKLPGV